MLIFQLGRPKLAIMFEVPLLFLRCLFAGFQSHSGLVFENLALRHQLAVLKRQARKPKLRCADRLLWVGLRRLWPHWQQALQLFQPQTIIGLAPAWLSLVLALEIPNPPGKTFRGSGSHHADSTDVAGQSDMGQSAHPGRTGQIEHSDLRFHNPQVPPQESTCALRPNLEDLFAKPCSRLPPRSQSPIPRPGLSVLPPGRTAR
jgi:hypothetical protein